MSNQVDGKTLCLLCTIKYKKDQFKKRNGTSSSGAVSGGYSATKRSRSSEHGSKPAETGYVVRTWVVMVGGVMPCLGYLLNLNVL